MDDERFTAFMTKTDRLCLVLRDAVLAYLNNEPATKNRTLVFTITWIGVAAVV